MAADGLERKGSLFVISPAVRADGVRSSCEAATGSERKGLLFVEESGGSG